MTTYTITETERIFLIEHAKDVRQLAMLESLQPSTQEPTAWMQTDCIGERFIMFDEPHQTSPLKDKVEPLFTHPAPQQPNTQEPKKPNEPDWLAIRKRLAELEDIAYGLEAILERAGDNATVGSVIATLESLREPQPTCIGLTFEEWKAKNSPNGEAYGVFSIPIKDQDSSGLSCDKREEIYDQLRNTFGVEGDIEEIVALTEKAILAKLSKPHSTTQQPADSAWKDAVLEQMANHGMDHGGTPEEVVKALIEMAVMQATDPAINQPPAPQAKPLTGEQIMNHEMWRSHAGHSFREKVQITRAIEAAHNIGVKP